MRGGVSRAAVVVSTEHVLPLQKANVLSASPPKLVNGPQPWRRAPNDGQRGASKLYLLGNSAWWGLLPAVVL